MLKDKTFQSIHFDQSHFTKNFMEVNDFSSAMINKQCSSLTTETVSGLVCLILGKRLHMKYLQIVSHCESC